MMKQFYGALWSRHHPWRVLVASGLIVTYLVLTGGALHCQMLMPARSAHHHDHSGSNGHNSHCALTNHCAIAAIHTAVNAGFDPLQITALSFHSHPAPAGFTLSVSRAPRGPPAVSPTV
ncbi:MAG TPA: hypothetical protein VLY45_03940 [Nitrospiria bacterium]|nr:hypothetical protein [Nitrospiria bacterium]